MPRIVSLIASATEIVHALGLFESLVGRSHECDFPEAVTSLPVCTRPAISVTGDSREIDRLVKDRLRAAVSVYEVFSDLLQRLQPTHILTQTQCEVCAVSLKDVEAALASGVSSLGVAAASGGVAWWAHVGGFLMGMLITNVARRQSNS